MPVLFESNEKADYPKRTEKIESKPSPMRFLSFFTRRPENVRFETQEDDEFIELVMRPHIITTVPQGIIGVVLAVLPAIIIPMLATTRALPLTIPPEYIIVLTMFWYVVVFGFLLTSLLRWYFNIYIVSNNRIVDIDFVQLLYKRFSYTRISRVQDVTYTQGGFVPTVFDYGNVLIQTAGEEDNFDFLNVPHPHQVVDTITDVARRAGAKAEKA